MMRAHDAPHDTIDPAAQSCRPFESVKSGVDHDENFLHDVVRGGSAHSEAPNARPNEVEVVAINSGEILHEGWPVRVDQACPCQRRRSDQVVSAHVFFHYGSGQPRLMPSRNPLAAENYRIFRGFLAHSSHSQPRTKPRATGPT